MCVYTNSGIVNLCSLAHLNDFIAFRSASRELIGSLASFF